MTRHFLFSVSLILFFSPPLLAQDFDDLNAQAYQERDNKNYRVAIDLCNQAINKKVNARSYIIRASSRYYLQEFTAAIDDYNSALYYYSDYYGTETKEKAGIYYFMGRCKQKLYRYNDAISDFSTALSFSYKDAGYAYWNRGVCYYSIKKYQEADDDYRYAISSFSDNKDLSSLYNNRADCQIALNKLEEAYTYYQKAAEYDPSDYNPYWSIGTYKSWEFKYNDALAAYDKAIEIINTSGNSANNSNLAILYRNKALMHKNLGKNNDAIEAINKSLEKDPNMAKTYKVRGDIYLDMKNYEKAKADYQNSITLETDNKVKSDMYLNRSIMEWNLLDYKSCLSDINKAIEADPEDGMNFWHRSILYGYKKNFVQAIKECNTALELYKNDSSSTASLLWLRASHKSFSGDFNGAMDDYRAYAKHYPGSYSVYYELGRLYKHKLKNNDLANANLSKAARLAWDAKDTSKYCYIKVINGDKDEPFKLMAEYSENVKDNNYDYKWQLHNMACLYSLSGNIAKGLEYLDKSMAAGFDDYLHLVNDRDLELLMKQPQWKTILTKYKVPVIKN